MILKFVVGSHEVIVTIKGEDVTVEVYEKAVLMGSGKK